MIPQSFHQIWLGGSPLPPQVEELRSTWREHHPGWEFRLWREDDLRWLRNGGLFCRATSYSQKADLARYEIIERVGGVYLDTDMECLDELGELVEGCSFFGGLEPSGAIASCIFGAEPGHPFLRQVIASFPISCLFNSDIMHQTGPGHLSTVFRRGGWEHRQGVRVYPAPYFNVYGLNVSEPGAEPSRASYAVHHAVYSWKGDQPLKATLRDCLPRSGYEARIVAGQLAERIRGSLNYRIVEPVRKRLVGNP